MNARAGQVRVSKPALLDGLRPGHEVIEASAGTGKTYTLQRLVADLVIRGASTIDRILVVTFTEKATQELRTRIRAYLQEVHDQADDGGEPPFWEIDAEARERLAAALRAFEQAPVSTIHGFCRQVLQEAALEGRTLFDRELADERALFGRAFREALSRVFTRQPEPAAMLQASLAAGRSIEALEQELWNVHADGGRLWPAWEDWRDWIDGLDPAWFAQADALVLDWKAAKVHHSTVASAAKALAALAADLPQADTDFRRAQVFDGLSLGSLWKAAAALEGDRGPLHRWLRRGEASLLSPEALLAHRFLPDVRGTQHRLAQTEGLFTFQGMVQGVVEALEGPDGEALAHRLRQRYDIALVDEFQDTDPLQWQVFRRIFLREDRRLVLIGDPKQAIYGFRGGDLPTYQAACAELLHGSEPQRLERNFRSTAAVIEAYNHVLGGGADGYFADPALYPRPVLCGLERLQATTQGRPIPPVDVLVLDTAQGGQGLWRRLARQLALRVRNLVASDIQFGEPGKTRALGYGDVQILVGKASEGELMARALRAEGIPCAFYKQKGLFQTREAEEWLDALRAVADPRNPSAQLRAFLSAFFGYSLADLRSLASLREDHPALQRLLAWGALARQQRFGELLEAMQEESGLARRLLIAEAGYRSLVNVRHIAEALMGAASQRRMTLEDLIRQLDRWRRGAEKPSAEEGDLQRLEGDQEAVQILTLHAAKGLEAPIVAVFAYGKGRGSGLIRFHRLGQRALALGAAPEAVKRQAAQEAQEESERLLYVGMTRAQAKLILCAFPGSNDKNDKNDKGAPRKLQNAYDPLNARLVKLLDQRSDLFQWERVAILDASAPEAGPARLPGHLALPPIPPAPAVDHAFLARAARPFITTSFTALQHRMELAEAPLRGDRDQAGARPGPGDLPAGPATGQALHELLEWADPAVMDSLAAWSKRPDVQAQIQAALDQHGLPRSCAAKAAETVYAGLRSDLPLAWGGAIQIGRCGRLLREVDFFSRFVDAGRFPREKDLLKGSIDALCEQDGRVYLLDWKSNLLPDYAPETLHATVMAHYLLQAQVYLQACLAFLDIRDEAAYEARFGGILYVFLRGLPGQGTWSLRPSWAECQAWQRELERIHQEVIHG